MSAEVWLQQLYLQLMQQDHNKQLLFILAYKLILVEVEVKIYFSFYYLLAVVRTWFQGGGGLSV